MTRVAVLQSSYIPWKGYFDIIHAVDRFVFYDDVQYTTRDWRNRNRIKTAQGPVWLTIPVGDNVHRPIEAVEISDPAWQHTHWKTIERAYRRSPGFQRYAEFFEQVYRRQTWTNLSALNRYLTERIARDFLNLSTEFDLSSRYATTGSKSDRLLDLVRQTGADVYVSGPSARDYLDEAAFLAAGIAVEYMNYAGYPEYPQPWPPFVHEVSILDLLFSVSERAPEFIWGWRTNGP